MHLTNKNTWHCTAPDIALNIVDVYVRMSACIKQKCLMLMMTIVIIIIKLWSWVTYNSLCDMKILRHVATPYDSHSTYSCSTISCNYIYIHTYVSTYMNGDCTGLNLRGLAVRVIVWPTLFHEMSFEFRYLQQRSE